MEQLKTSVLPRDDIADFIKSPRGVRSYEALQGDAVNLYEAINTGSFLTVTDSPSLGAERVLTLTSDLSGVDGGANAAYTLGLSATTVAAGPYGSASKIAGFTVDAKGRLTGAAEYALNSDNVTEGSTNLFYTNARARAAISATSPVGYDTATGIISFNLTIDVDTTLSANSDSHLATQKAVKAYVDNSVVGLLDLKGNLNCAANPNYPAASKGDAYYVSDAGKIGGASGKSVDIGDVVVASADNAGGTEAAVGTSWFVLEHNLTGALLAANNLSDLTNTTTARTNLGATTVGAGIFTLTNPSAVTYLRINADNSLSTLTAAQFITAMGTPQFVSTIGVGTAASASGSGVSFPAAQSASTDPNTLDDYEEGTWTPTVTAGSGTITTVSATGYYTKIGRQVNATMTITITTNGTGGTLVNATLPFTSATGPLWIGAGREGAVTGNMLQAIVQSAATVVNIATYNNAYPGSSGAVLYVSVSYFV